jgi:LuxR family transcriptional regulator, positive regulator of biofilm formation
MKHERRTSGQRQVPQKSVKILISISNYLFFEALKCLLLKEKVNGRYGEVYDQSTIGSSTPDIILADHNNVGNGLLFQYPGAKTLLIDTGLTEEAVISLLSSYEIHGVISPQSDINLFKRALKVVGEGEIWIDSNTMQVLVRNKSSASGEDKTNTATEREREIIEYVTLGYTNKEIAEKLFVSEQTVKAHLNRIFKKFNVSSRSKLTNHILNNRTDRQIKYHMKKAGMQGL